VTPEGLCRAEEPYPRALDLEESRRAEFLECSGGGDELLLQEVKSLPAHQEEAERVIESSALQVVGNRFASQPQTRESEKSLVGRTVSHDHIIEKLGGLTSFTVPCVPVDAKRRKVLVRAGDPPALPGRQ
jgi:hypothetical protein